MSEENPAACEGGLKPEPEITTWHVNCVDCTEIAELRAKNSKDPLYDDLSYVLRQSLRD